MEEYVAGFIDGDASIQLFPPDHKHPLPVPRVQLYQSRDAGPPPELEYIQKHFGGTLHVAREAEGLTRKSWVLVIASIEESAKILSVVKKCGVMKCGEAQIALDYLEGGREDSEFAIAALKLERNTRNDIEILSERLTDAFLAGLFAADGYIGVDRWRIKACITRRDCTSLLEAIQKKLGYGNVSAGKIQFASGQTEDLLTRIRPHLEWSQKREQVDAALEFHRSRTSKRGRKRSVEENDKIERLKKKLSKLKKM